MQACNALCLQQFSWVYFISDVYVNSQPSFSVPVPLCSIAFPHRGFCRSTLLIFAGSIFSSIALSLVVLFEGHCTIQKFSCVPNYHSFCKWNFHPKELLHNHQRLYLEHVLRLLRDQRVVHLPHIAARLDQWNYSCWRGTVNEHCVYGRILSVFYVSEEIFRAFHPFCQCRHLGHPPLGATRPSEKMWLLSLSGSVLVPPSIRSRKCYECPFQKMTSQ